MEVIATVKKSTYDCKNLAISRKSNTGAVFNKLFEVRLILYYRKNYGSCRKVQCPHP